jgi:NAD-reducing hydrogenase large subunit
MLNLVEIAIRAYDPCLSCATHAIGDMPLRIELFNHSGQLIGQRTKDSCLYNNPLDV